MKAELTSSASFPGAERTTIRQAFHDEGIDTEISPNCLEYTSNIGPALD